MRFFLCAAAILLWALPVTAQTKPTLGTERHPEYGRYVTDANGRPVYVFVTDERGGDDITPIKSCKQRCQKDWPLVTVADDITVSDDLDPFLAAVLKWDGLLVGVYNSNALFYFANEDGDATPDGHGIHTYGGWWYLIDPDGEPIVTGILPETDG
ncbi:MAG: hypothetical protein AAFO80_01075 [Pseudomonadota bacterium]